MSDTPSAQNTAPAQPKVKDVPVGTRVQTTLKAPGTPLNVKTPPPPDPFIAAFDEMILKTLDGGDPVAGTFIKFMQDYVVAMDPKAAKPLNRGPAAAYQKRFYLAMRAIIEKSSASTFRKNWTVVLSFFYRYRDGVLGERYVNRFSEYWQNKDPSLPIYQRLVNLCMVSRDPKDRANAKTRVDINRTMEVGFTPVGETNIKSYYGI